MLSSGASRDTERGGEYKLTTYSFLLHHVAQPITSVMSARIQTPFLDCRSTADSCFMPFCFEYVKSKFGTVVLRRVCCRLRYSCMLRG